MSATTNLRTDTYGGSLRNRARLIVEIAQAIQKRVKPSFILNIKLNSVEFQENGFQPEEARELVTILEDNKFDFVELSGGTYEKFVMRHERDSTKHREAFFIEFAEKITPALKQTKSYITGGLKTVGAMVKVSVILFSIYIDSSQQLTSHCTPRQLTHVFGKATLTSL